MELGYVRVSTVDQHTDRQLAELNIPVENLYIDRCSGKDTNRPELQNLLRAAREGDVIHIHSLDRLGRNLKDLMGIIETFTKKGCEVRIHKENIILAGDKSNPMNMLILQIFGALAEWERSIIRERQAEGIAAAKSKGKVLGRPKNFTEEQRQNAREWFQKDPEACIARVSRETGVPKGSCRLIRKAVQEELRKEKMHDEMTESYVSSEA